MKIKKIINLINILLFIILIQNSGFANDGIMQAMQDEIDRTMQSLKLDGLQKPYYIEYKLTVRHSYGSKCVLGSLSDDTDTKTATLSVGIRVGDYKFDNTNFFDFAMNFFGSGDDEEPFRNRQVPIEIDYNSLRRELWLATDAAYKRAAESFSKKEASLKNRVRKDTIDDFIKLSPEIKIDTLPFPAYNKTYFEQLLKDISVIFKKYPEIYSSTADIEYLPETVYFLNSEGRKYIKTNLYTGLEIVAQTQSKDGMPLVNFYSSYSLKPDDIPSRDSILKATKQLVEKLVLLKNANILDEPYSGPVFFEGQAAAELFAQVFAPNLATQRDQVTEAGTREGDRNTAFQNKIGGRVTSEFISVKAVPTNQKFNGIPLTGYYKIDDEGVEAQEVNLVQDGYLRNLLSSRVPTRRVRSTNGHQRGGAAMLSNIQVASNGSKDLEKSALFEKLNKLSKDRELKYAIVVRKVLNQNIMFTTVFRLLTGDFPMPQKPGTLSLTEVYKLYPDGHEELVRGCEAVGFTTQSFKDIINVGKQPYVLNLLAPSITSSFVTGGSQYIGASVIVPDMLFEDGEIRPLQQDFTKPPILANPLMGDTK